VAEVFVWEITKLIMFTDVSEMSIGLIFKGLSIKDYFDPNELRPRLYLYLYLLSVFEVEAF
jgi:hypothetical protein